MEPALKDLSRAKKTIQAQKRSIAELERSVKRLTSVLDKQVRTTGKDTQAAKAQLSEKWRKDTVRSTRRKLQLTQTEMAELLGVSIGSVNGWETGRTEPREARKQEVLAVRALTPSEAQDRLG